MAERPILFAAPMVQALLAGAKTQTRRAVKPQPGPETKSGHFYPSHIAGDGQHRPAGALFSAGLTEAPPWSAPKPVRCPYGQPGDRLWVRETWGHFERNDTLKRGDTIYYRADGECLEIQPWRPSIHMFRWASRITLEVTGVRVERLQDISRGDAMAEGCPFPNMAKGDDPRAWYADLWEQINGVGSWSADPWVWVVEFRRVEG